MYAIPMICAIGLKRGAALHPQTLAEDGIEALKSGAMKQSLGGELSGCHVLAKAVFRSGDALAKRN